MTHKIKGPNPKEAMGAAKAPMNACPNTALVELYNVMGGGAWKYGLYNFRDTDISAMTYIGAIRRHMFLWEDGEDNDPESHQSHLAHIMACCALAIDAGHTGKLIDDRSKTGVIPELLRKSADSFADYKQANKSAEERAVYKEGADNIKEVMDEAILEYLRTPKGTKVPTETKVPKESQGITKESLDKMFPSRLSPTKVSKEDSQKMLDNGKPGDVLTYPTDPTDWGKPSLWPNLWGPNWDRNR